jgi:hypothetical protein
MRLLSLLAVFFSLSGLALAGGNTVGGSNPPWFPSLMAFEHYDSGRTKLFTKAKFKGSFEGDNAVEVRVSPDVYLTPYNIVYLSEDSLFVYGGGYGDKGGTGAFVARVDRKTLQTLWYNQLINTVETDEWDYPGVVSVLKDGFLYVIYGYRLAKLDPKDGHVVGQVELPTLAAPRNTSYNGFDGLPDGTLIAKTVYREAGCEEQGFSAFLDCPHPLAVPHSLVVAINPKTLEVIDQIEAEEFSVGRLTSVRFGGKDYIYLAGTTKVFRYLYENSHLTLDTSWGPVVYLHPASGQTPASALVVMNDWVVFTTNGSPATGAGFSPWLSVIAINQADATQQFVVQPFKTFPSPPGYPFSLANSAVAVDPQRNRIFALDTGPGRIGALELDSDGLHTVWTAPQRTTEFLLLIGPSRRSRVLVGTAIPDGQKPGQNTQDQVVWREADTGRELARSPLLPAVLSGTMIQPGYAGRAYYLAENGIIELTVQPSE